MNRGAVTGTVFDIDTFAVHDGPGIRMAVYLKGCPLGCAWCHSPESQSPVPELVYVKDRCSLCGRCAAVCPTAVHVVDPSGHVLNREYCTTCGSCVEVCPNGALAIKGRVMEAREIVERALRMRPFFDASGGGVTLSGGEVTLQPEFTLAILGGLRDAGIHTVVETAGLCTRETLEAVSRAADKVYYDVKLIRDDEHRRWTGAGNSVILENLRYLDPAKTVVRVPLVPGITDTAENITGICRTVEEAGLQFIEYLPFNGSADAKYEWLGREIAVAGDPQSDEKREEILRLSSAAAAVAVTFG